MARCRKERCLSPEWSGLGFSGYQEACTATNYWCLLPRQVRTVCTSGRHPARPRTFHGARRARSGV